jgi:hypothetical protein
MLATPAWAFFALTLAGGTLPDNLPAPPVPSPELRHAVEAFRTASRELGLREDSPRRGRAASQTTPPFHGRLYHNFRNDFLDATPHEVNQRGGNKNLLRRNQFGFNLSGPLVLPHLYNGGRKTFFSVSYEGVRERIGRSYLRTIPIGPENSGDFSHTVDSAGNQLAVYDPASTRPNPDYGPTQPVSTTNLQYLRDPFPGNQIPSGRIDPVARRLVSYYPQPNSTAGPFNSNNYFVFSPETNTANGMIIKVDHNFLEKHRLAITASFTNGLAGSARFLDNAANPGPAGRNFTSRRLSVDHILTISPARINTLSIDLTSDVSTNVTERGDFASQLGISGVPGDVFPWFSLSPYLSLGLPNAIARNARRTYVVTESHSIRIGKHNHRLVAQYVRHQVNTFQPQFPAGYFHFSPGLTSLPGIVNTGHAFATMLLGAPDYAEVSYVLSPSYWRNWRGRLAWSDTWEARPGLTVSMGLNTAIDGPRTEKYDRMSTIDFQATNPEDNRPGAIVFAGRGGHSKAFQSVLWRPQPSLSLAWSPKDNRKSVLRMSYGLSYGSYVMPNGQWATQGFNGYATFYSQNAQLDPALILTTGVPSPSTSLPDLRPDAANNTAADLVDSRNLLPRYQSSGLSYERELPSSTVLSGGLSVAWGDHLFVGNSAAQPNAVSPDALVFRDQLNDESFIRELRPYPQYLRFDVNGMYAGGRYRREEAWLRLEKRTSQGLSLNLSYTCSRQHDDYSGPYGKQDFFNAQNEWSLTSGNNPHRLSLSYMYELPLGAGKSLLPYQDWRRWLVSGWAISGVSSVASGEPLALHPEFNNTGGVVQALRVDTVPGVDPSVPNPGPDLWFNPAAFSQPPDFTLGDGPRTHPTLRNPMSQNHDLSVVKRFALDRQRTVELNASGFNFVNHANWNDPDTMIGPASAPNLNAGKIIGSRGGRVIQLGLRFSF